MKLTDNILGITVGIRYSRSFRIPDVSGDIIDDILYSNDTPFGTKTFDLVRDSSSREKLLLNESTGEFLRINTDDLIFAIKVEKDFDKKIDFIKNDVFNYLQNKIFKKYEIQNIRRIGIIYQHGLKKSSDFPKIVKEATKGELINAENISLSFSKKLATTDGLVKKDVKDYRNIIFILNEVKKSFLANLDYQYYFEPAVQDLRDCKPLDIIKESQQYLEDDFYKWLIQYESK